MAAAVCQNIFGSFNHIIITQVCSILPCFEFMTSCMIRNSLLSQNFGKSEEPGSKFTIQYGCPHDQFWIIMKLNLCIMPFISRSVCFFLSLKSGTDGIVHRIPVHMLLLLFLCFHAQTSVLLYAGLC